MYIMIKNTFFYTFKDFIQFQHKLIIWRSDNILNLPPSLHFYLLYMHAHAIHTYTRRIYPRYIVDLAKSGRVQTVNQRMNRNQTGQTSGCVILVWTLAHCVSVPACVLAYVPGCVLNLCVYVYICIRDASVEILLSCYLEQSGGHKSRRRHRVRLDMRAACLSQGDIKMSIKQPLSSLSYRHRTIS